MIIENSFFYFLTKHLREIKGEEIEDQYVKDEKENLLIKNDNEWHQEYEIIYRSHAIEY